MSCTVVSLYHLLLLFYHNSLKPAPSTSHIHKMARAKSSLRKATNFSPLLQDIRGYLGENYVFYEECIVAISRAARRENAFAWFEQMERLVEGVDEVAFSHAGVKFLLREMARGEGELLAPPQLYKLVVLRLYLAPLVNAMPPPPLPHCIRPTRLLAMNPRTPTNGFRAIGPAAPNTPLRSPFVFLAPPTPTSTRTPILSPFEAPQMIYAEPAPTGLKNPDRDPMFFTDPAFKTDVNAFWGTPKGSDYTPDYGNGTPDLSMTSDRELAAMIPRYDPADDDLQIFRETAARAAAAREKETKLEPERGQLVKELHDARNMHLACDPENLVSGSSGRDGKT
jgi:hypothetical protein